jgi:diguanylate cyclase (GGDEF)-like protein
MGTGVWLYAVANLTSLDTAGTLFQTQEALHPFDDIAAVAASVSVWVALGAVPSKTRRWNNLRWLNSAILVISAFTLIWVLTADASLAKVSGSAKFGIVAGYIALDAITVAFAVSTSSRSRLSNRADTRAMVIGAALLAISNLVTVLALIGQRSRLGEQVGHGVSVMALLLIGVGAGRAFHGLTDGRPFGTRIDRFQRTAPVIAVIAAIVAVIIHEVLEGGDDLLSLAFGVACVLLAALRLNMLERTQERLASELVEIAHRMETEANKDALTGLGNRAGLGIHLDNALNRQSQSGVSVFYIDIDHFKSVNDGLGHEAGDQLLVEIADRLSNVLGDDVFRIGGDEFVAVREDLNQVEAESVALALVASMEQPVHVLGRRMNAAVSVGLARSDLRRAPEPDPSSGWPTRRTDTADAVLRRADLALYRAKELGRGRWATYDPWLQQRADRQLQMQQGLYRRICLRTGEEWTAEGEAAFRTDVLAKYADFVWASAMVVSSFILLTLA